ncbi:MAG TPA: serine/threonine-protein kinase [Kofleriaceae bacterium]|nr:serine/threonine-protein kinase [Kofleriaceae bacterium]
MNLAAGTIFAERYEILATQGRGGMGYVYRARHLGLAKNVALKVLATSKLDYEERFAREARAVARLDHPGCVRVLDHGRADGAQYIAMELIDGETLGTVLQRGRFTKAHALDIARQLLHALAHAHAQGVIHRDIKPENIMLTPLRHQTGGAGLSAGPGGKRAVLIDFGLATVRNELPLTGAGMCVGSPSYVAPERLLGRPHDTRTDLYAVGVVLYEMIAGVKPFNGTSPEHTMRLALHRPPRPLRAFRRDIPAVLDRVIRRALQKDPGRRFQDAEEMLLALNDVPTDEEIAERIAAAEREEQDEAAATIAIARLEIREPSLLSRIWTWLRYGGWRWRHG